MPTIRQRLGRALLQPRTILVVYIMVAIVASLHLISLGTHEFSMPRADDPNRNDIIFRPENLERYKGLHITEYNNYVIFRQSYRHLAAGQDLYSIHPTEHWDFFKYSPAFALFMGLLAWLPDAVGLPLWNLLNALVLFYAISRLPLEARKRSLLLWFVLPELLTSLQSAQSNALIAGLIILAYTCLQRGKGHWAALWLVAATFIKPYGAIGFCLWLFYPQKGKFILYVALWTVLFAALPLVATTPALLQMQYQSWAAQLAADQAASYGLSVVGWLKSWFGIDPAHIKTPVTILGMLLFLLPLARVQLYKNELYRLLVLAGMLIWVIIFNHKAESPTFIIAVAGVGIWYFASPKATWRTVLLWTVFVFTCLSPTDLFPPVMKANFLVPYNIKVVPCIVVWCVVVVGLLGMRKRLA